MTILRLVFLLLAIVVVCSGAPIYERVDTPQQSKLVEDKPVATDIESKKELLALIDKLEPKLPKPLQRKLIVISMKLATGWCSPYLTAELQDDIDKLSVLERAPFEVEWKEVSHHKAWPRLPNRTPPT